MMDHVLDYYIDNYSQDIVLSLLQTIAHPSQGGLGYKIETFNPLIDIDGWEIDHARKIIKLDSKPLNGRYSSADIADNLKNAIEVGITKQRTSLLSRIGWGAGKTLIGVIETAVGIVGILVPEPGTTAAGIGMVTLGANSITDGITQLAGANNANGYNLLASGFGGAGSLVADLAGYDPHVGNTVGRGVFLVSSIAFGSVGSIKILNIKSTSSIHFGVAKQPGGFELGRLQMLYSSNRAKDGMTILNINNNSGKYILRFVTHDGKLVVNGRIFGVQRVMKHEGNWREITKGLTKLLVHGAKNGW